MLTDQLTSALREAAADLDPPADLLARVERSEGRLRARRRLSAAAAGGVAAVTAAVVAASTVHSTGSSPAPAGRPGGPSPAPKATALAAPTTAPRATPTTAPRATPTTALGPTSTPTSTASGDPTSRVTTAATRLTFGRPWPLRGDRALAAAFGPLPSQLAGAQQDLWAGRLPDGSLAVVVLVRPLPFGSSGGTRVVTVVHHPDGTTSLEGQQDDIDGLLVYAVRIPGDRPALLVLAAPGTGPVSQGAEGGTYTPLPTEDGVALGAATGLSATEMIRVGDGRGGLLVQQPVERLGTASG